MDTVTWKQALVGFIAGVIIMVIAISALPPMISDMQAGWRTAFAPAPPTMINVIFKDRIDSTNLPLTALPDNPDISAPVAFDSADTTWIRVFLSDGRKLWINRDLVASWSAVPAATAATSQAAQ